MALQNEDHRVVTVLLVEDNPGDADLVLIACEAAPPPRFLMRVAVDLREALHTMQTLAVDVILLDLGLPDACGMEALHSLRHAAPEIPIVVLTSLDNRSLSLQSLREGAQDYLVKGRVDSSALERSVRYALMRQQYVRHERALADAKLAQATAERAQERACVLANASEVLGKTMDYEAGLRDLAHMLVPRFADMCVVELAHDQSLQLLCSVAYSAGNVESADGNGEGSCTSALVLRDGYARTYGRMSGPWEGGAHHGALPASLQKGAFKSAVIVPIASTRKVLGALTMALGGDRTYDSEDVRTAVDLGGRAGAAVENIELYRAANVAVGLRDDFLSIAAHELRTPLMALKLQLQLLQRNWPSQAVPAAFANLGKKVDGAHHQANRLCNLVESLLDVSRITSGRLELCPEPLNLAAILHEIADRFEPGATANGCRIRIGAASSVLGDWDRLGVEQIITNLVSNAIKYAPGGFIDLDVVADGQRATLTVGDNGIGIAAADLDRIFARFERAVSKLNFAGLGLGLYVVRHIVEAHGGEISVQSTPGYGSVFRVTLPLRGAAGVERSRS